jgi:hypothetical protein
MRRDRRYYRKPTRETSLYAISANAEFIKFGFAAKPGSRLAELQVGSPFELKLLATLRMPDQASAADLEKRVHVAVARFHFRGEWFYSCPKTLAVAGFMERGAAEFERLIREFGNSEVHYALRRANSAVASGLRAMKI